MTSENGLIVAYLLDGEGGGHRIEWDEIKTWKPERGFLWVHLCYTDSAARQWVRDQSGLDELVGEALLVEETRPRSLMTRSGLLAVLRGVNLNPGADPEDMVSIRIWIDQHRVISHRVDYGSSMILVCSRQRPRIRNRVRRFGLRRDFR